MWPWEHLAFGYVLVSLVDRALRRRPPKPWEAVAVVVATQAPDLVDKPLGWGLNLYATGYGAAHSLFVAGPLLVLGAVYGVKRRSAVAVAFVVAYASHLLGDVLAAAMHGNPSPFARLLWPVSHLHSYSRDLGFTRRALYYFGRLATDLADPRALAPFAVYASIFVAVGLLWLRDGAPGTSLLRAALDRLVAS